MLAFPVSRPGRSREAFSNERPRGMVTPSAMKDRTRLTGHLTFVFFRLVLFGGPSVLGIRNKFYQTQTEFLPASLQESVFVSP
jgi:hypothetical protein